MRKVLLSVMTVGFLLAFNACKKGDQGPAGPAGPTGTPGTAGAVGPAGAAGADGSKILTGAGAPAAATGANGDFYFDSTAKSLYGPKAAGAWPAAGVVLSGPAGAAGANGATGATGATGTTGAAGTQFLAGAGAPANGVGNVGDFYFDTNNSVFYGPKGTGATPWAASAGSNVMPIGRAYAAKTFYLTRGFEGVTETSKTFGEVATESWGPVNIFSSYEVTANDMIRINQYGVAGWAKNREMIFQSVPGSGIWNAVPTSAAQLGVAPFIVGAKFRYSENRTNPAGSTFPIAEFTLTQDDIDRLQVNAGAAFGYLTYAQADVSTVALGKTLNFYGTKRVDVAEATSGANYNATYTAQTRLDLNTIPGLGANIEKYKQEGKVFVKYRYFTANPANTPVSHVGDQAGWIDLTSYANSYVKAVSYGVDNSDTNPTLFPGPFTAAAYSSVTNVNPFVAGAANFMATGQIIGNAGTTVTLAANQTATAVTLPSTTYNDGVVVINWNINSGTNLASAPTATAFGPMTLTNPGNTVEDYIAPGTFTIVNDGTRIARTFETTYYSAPALTSNKPVSATGFIDVVARTGGQSAAYFAGTKLVQVQVLVIPGDVVKTARAKGVDVNNAAELGKFISLDK